MCLNTIASFIHTTWMQDDLIHWMEKMFGIIISVKNMEITDSAVYRKAITPVAPMLWLRHLRKVILHQDIELRSDHSSYFLCPPLHMLP